MSYTRCRRCKFWVTSREWHCPNCGSFAASGAPPGPAVGAVLGLIAGGLGVLIAGDGRLIAVTAACMAGAFGGGVIGSQVRGVFRTESNLRRWEKTIRQRIAETDRALARLETLRVRLAAEPPDSAWQPVRAALDSAAETLPAHRDRYRLGLFRIELTRWLNELEPLATGWEELGFEGCDRRLGILDSLTRHAETMQRAWSDSGLTRLPEAAPCEERLAMGIEACEALRRLLIARQAGTLMQYGTPPPEVALSEVKPLRWLEEFSARVEVGAFGGTLEALEAEHARYEAALEVAALGGPSPGVPHARPDLPHRRR